MSDNACCFCGDDVGRYGHNPAPVSDTGRCCDVCNQMVVIPARISMMGFRSEDWQEVFGESSFPAGYEGDIADKILTDTYGEWWVWSGDEPMDDPDNWNYIHDGAEGLYLGVHEYVSFLSGDDYDEVPITNLTEDNKEEIRDFLGFAAEDEYDEDDLSDCDVCGEMFVAGALNQHPTTLYTTCYQCFENELEEDDEGWVDVEDFNWDAETILPGNITDIIMDEYLEQGESYEDAQEYARVATEKLKLDAEEDEIMVQMLEIEDMENPSEEDLDNLQSLESRYFELTGTFGAEKWTPGPALPALIATDTPAPSIGSSQKEEPIFPAEAIEELKKHIIVFTGAGMMLSVFAAVGGFLLGRRTKEC